MFHVEHRYGNPPLIVAALTPIPNPAIIDRINVEAAMRKLLIVAVIFFSAGAVFAKFSLDGTRPQKMIMVWTSIGQVAGTENRIEVNLVQQLNTDDERTGVMLSDKALLGDSSHPIFMPEVSKVADALTFAALHLNEGRKTVSSSSCVDVKIESGSKGNIVRLVFPKTKEFSFESNSIDLDGDNAEFLATLLRKSLRIDEWLESRTSDLRKGAE